MRIEVLNLLFNIIHAYENISITRVLCKQREAILTWPYTYKYTLSAISLLIILPLPIHLQCQQRVQLQVLAGLYGELHLPPGFLCLLSIAASIIVRAAEELGAESTDVTCVILFDASSVG